MTGSKKQHQRIAQERILYLYSLAEEKLLTLPNASRRAIEMMRSVATKYNVLLCDQKRTFCLSCNTLLVPGKTCSVRVTKEKRILTCLHCGKVKRLAHPNLRSSPAKE